MRAVRVLERQRLLQRGVRQALQGAEVGGRPGATPADHLSDAGARVQRPSVHHPHVRPAPGRVVAEMGRLRRVDAGDLQQLLDAEPDLGPPGVGRPAGATKGRGAADRLPHQAGAVRARDGVRRHHAELLPVPGAAWRRRPQPVPRAARDGGAPALARGPVRARQAEVGAVPDLPARAHARQHGRLVHEPAARLGQPA